MKAFWKGSLNFGLITLDIELFTAINVHGLAFKLLHDVCHKQIHNVHWCDHCNQAVTWDHIVKGLPLNNEKFFILTNEALSNLKSLKSDVITIETFIPADALEPIWLESHYFALPRKQGDRAYALFVAALEDSKKIALGKVIFRQREHVCALQPYGDCLLLSTLHFSHEIRPLPPQTTTIKFTSEELELAQYLIEKMSFAKIRPETFKDTFVENLKKALKSRSKKSIPMTNAKKKTGTKKQSLTDLLKQSVSTLKTKKSAKKTT